jgi:hypothetical protein
MKNVVFLGFAFSLLLPLPLLAYDADRATNNLAHELADCGAYFSLVAEAPGLDPNTKKGLSERGTLAMASSAKLTSQKLALARFDLALQGMKRDMEGNWSNLSVVNARYGYQCQDLLKDPEARMKYWLEKKD